MCLLCINLYIFYHKIPSLSTNFSVFVFTFIFYHYNLAKDYGLNARVIDNPRAPLKRGEWVIVFWGFYARNCYDPDDYSGMWNCVPNQFHFGFLSENGRWVERKGIGEPLVEFDLDSKISLFRTVQLEPKFFAVKAK